MGLFESETKKSGKIYEEARKLSPGGVSGNAAYLAPYPIYVDRAVGSRLFDVDERHLATPYASWSFMFCTDRNRCG